MFAPLPLKRVLAAWTGVAVALLFNDAIHDLIFAPLFGNTIAGVLTALLSIASVVTITAPFFRPYSGQWAESLAWYGVVLAALTVGLHTILSLYVDRLFGYEILAQYNILKGQLWSLVVITVALTPFIWSRWTQP